MGRLDAWRVSLEPVPIMTPNLPEALEQILRPLFTELPIARAMDKLVVVAGDAPAERVQLVSQAIATPALADQPGLVAGLWLYVDQLDRAHEAAQSMQTPEGSFWHAIMHRREGDFSNSHYWYRRAGHHPAMSRIAVAGGGAGAGTSVGHYDPHDLVDRVQRAHEKGEVKHPELVSLQRREWAALFEYCAEHR